MADEDAPDAHEDEREGRDRDKTLFERAFEKAVPDMVKRIVERAVESSVEKLHDGPENLRQFVGDMKLPKEALTYLYQQIDETKTGLYRVVAKEIRDVLEHTQFADEITKVLTKLSFEIRTEIRFVPNKTTEPTAEGDADGRGLPKPEVKAHVSMKDRGRDSRPPKG